LFEILRSKKKNYSEIRTRWEWLTIGRRLLLFGIDEVGFSLAKNKKYE
jgi:hypothetical protein